MVEDEGVFTRSLILCRKCPRLVAWREEVAEKKRRAYSDWDYWGKPVPGFGDPQARLLVVGLAPGAHGSNRTGRVFTGDDSGVFLYRALHRAGFANQPEARHKDDGLILKDAYITAICRCVPPDNRPNPDEITNCQPYLIADIQRHPDLLGLVALGKIALDGLLAAYRSLGYEIPRLPFSHGEVHALGEGLPWLVCSYHPSRQNTQTGRLTEAMFDQIWQTARSLLQQRQGSRV
jgi:uracil-DNA glycosylase family 4